VPDYSHTPIVELAAIIAKHLRDRDIRVVLVGGLAVEIYSENIYLTRDIDMVDISYQRPAKLHQAMAEIGFVKRGRVFVNDTTDVTVEFPAPPITVGDQAVTETTTVSSAVGEIPILMPGDIIKDRLAAYFHWRDRPSLVQALALLVRFSAEVKSVEAFCRSEGYPEAITLLSELLKAAAEQRINSMAGIEKLVVERILQDL